MFSYTPAGADHDSWGVVTDRFVLAIATDVGHALDLWHTMQQPDAALESILEVLARRGLRAVPDFALVELLDAPTGSISIALRGRGRAELGGAQHEYFSGKGAGTWVEASAQRIAEMTVGLRGEPPGPARLPLGRGVVRTEQIHWGVPLPRLEALVSEPDTPEWAAETPDPGGSTDVDIDDLTVLGSRRARPQDAADEPADDKTVLGIRKKAVPRVRLRFDSGDVVDLDTPVVFGRAPRSRAGAVPHVLASPHQEVSATHAELRPRTDGAIVRDLRSTNGTIVTPRGGTAIEVRDREMMLAHGDRVDFGDGNSAEVQVSAPPAPRNASTR